MPKEEWGTKRLCPTTGKRFYDLNRNPIVSPYTGEVVTVDTARSRTMVADAEDAQTKKLQAKKSSKENGDEEDLLIDDEENSDDVNLGDDVLEDDDDDDDVSFEDLGDVASNDSDE